MKNYRPSFSKFPITPFGYGDFVNEITVRDQQVRHDSLIYFNDTLSYNNHNMVGRKTMELMTGCGKKCGLSCNCGQFCAYDDCDCQGRC